MLSAQSNETILSIVIVNWNTRDYLLGALKSIYSTQQDIVFETIVVDNLSYDGSADSVRSGYPQVKLIANTENSGYAKGNNQGIEAATGQFILLLNPDVVVPNNALSGAADYLRKHPEAGALGVRLVNPDGSTQRSVRGFPTPLAVFCEATGLSRIFSGSRIFGAYRMTWFTYEEPAEVDQPMGTFLLIPRQTMEQVGLLDERFPIFFNEVDWCFRARKAGWKILYMPDIKIVHYGGGSTKQVKPKMAWESRRGLLDFYRKHYPSPMFAPVFWLAVVGSWVQAKIVSSRRTHGQEN